MLFVRSVALEASISRSHLPAALHALTQRPLKLRAPVTILSGDNGAGKSTLLEAIARAMGFHGRGGPRGMLVTQTHETQDVHDYLRISRGGSPRDGYFLRGETHLDIARTYRDDIEGAPDLLARSHGESVMHILRHRCGGDGLYIFDEPEDGLSVLRQLEALGIIATLARAGSQVLMATHSPILLAVPDAQIVELTSTGIRAQSYEQTQAVRDAREFLSDPEGTAEFLSAEEEP
ncbi:AAA family ATPase [Corynebacterium uberis]|uniref:AAA family ATPase n=1 Tax=Corynebacterium TaxID=1716 RepID=UPI001D09B5B9|nr:MULTISPECIES: AAA family ATPase [Corynebacterium]MCZ9309040.1 AAA family ATPase [Corynebacterium sp. c6VSa_13]UDL74494.1 AAA family ATPase [Corynebacterium uberis]UDL76671.1 AAA family ATPase [Corynebacterium uberis]UDL78884.1 AAA family ATPase [Corynebacterium uberis]UDL81162.1 AAA family ATPase [Corynebacterium uberis]